MQVLGRTQDGAINAIIDGVAVLVPDDMANRHRRQIAEEWEATGGVIPPYAAPVLSPEQVRAAMPALTSRQFWLAANAIGISESIVLAQVETIEAPAERDALRIEVAKTSDFSRVHPAVDDLSGLLGITPEQLDDLWIWGAQL